MIQSHTHGHTDHVTASHDLHDTMTMYVVCYLVILIVTLTVVGSVILLASQSLTEQLRIQCVRCR